MEFRITKEELKTILDNKNEELVSINQLLMNDPEVDIALFAENKIDYSKDTVIKNIDAIKQIYKIIIENFEENDNWKFYRNTNIAEFEKIKVDNYINNMLFATEENKLSDSQTWGRPILMVINGSKNVPYLNLKAILNQEDKIIISPFTKITEIIEMDDDSVKKYEINLECQEMDSLPKDESDKLYNEIIEKSEEINKRMNACIELDKEISIHYENIRKLEQLLAKHNLTMEQPNYEIDTSDIEKQNDLDDIARINLELDSLKSVVTKVFYIRKENTDFILDWKKDIAVYLMSQCKEILVAKEDNKIEEKTNDGNIENTKIESNIEAKDINVDDNKNDEEIKLSDDPIINSVKQECLENIAMVDTLLDNIKKLISKQQNYARIAESIDSHYKALNNAFEMRNYAEELEVLVKGISNKVDTLDSEDSDKLEEISKISLQVSTLINYLNNPRSAVSKHINRFDEINIIEENELKKEIAETIKDIRCEAELKKLRDDVDIIEDKSSFKKFIDKFTGRDKIDETMLNQIEVRQTAIRKTFKNKMPLAYNYSIHELIAEIEMFISENEDDDLVLEDVNVLRKIESTLKKNFVIMDNKVTNIIDRKNGKNLPVASKKISKQELIEIDTYRFLNRYGYDKSKEINEPIYQDTLANEIKRIIDYIKSSNIF